MAQTSNARRRKTGRDTISLCIVAREVEHSLQVKNNRMGLDILVPYEPSYWRASLALSLYLLWRRADITSFHELLALDVTYENKS